MMMVVIVSGCGVKRTVLYLSSYDLKSHVRDWEGDKEEGLGRKKGIK